VASANKSIETRGTAMKTVSPGQDRTGIEEIGTTELALPPSVQAALGELVNAAKDGLLALSVGVGLGVLNELMETEVDEVVGPKSQHDPDRVAAMRPGRSRSAVAGSACSARGSGPRTAARRSRLAATSISRRAIR
jgi:hypothetical protein